MTPVDEVNRTLREFYIDAGMWDLRAWVGGYELGLSRADPARRVASRGSPASTPVPPDWVGESVFTVEEEGAAGTFEAGIVTSFDSIFHLPIVDTIVYEEHGAGALSNLPRDLVTVPC